MMPFLKRACSEGGMPYCRQAPVCGRELVRTGNHNPPTRRVVVSHTVSRGHLNQRTWRRRITVYDRSDWWIWE